MELTARQLNRATLARQMLLGREPLNVSDGLRRVRFLQAQEPASPYLALWSRLAGFDPNRLDGAFTSGEVVKATLVRITLHAIHAEDYPAIHTAMVPSLRGSRIYDRRFKDAGLTAAAVDEFVPELLEYLSQPHPGAEIDRLVEERFGEPQPRVFWAIRTFGPLHHHPTGGPWSFRSPSHFVAAPEALRPEHPDAVQELILRYLEAFGPATAADIGLFSILRVPVVGPALESLADQLVVLEGPGKGPYYDLPGALIPSEDTPAPPRLLPMWDSVLLAYSDRSRVIPEEYRKVVIRNNGDVLPTVLVDGYVAGVWRTVEGGVEVTSFRGFDKKTWEGLAEEAASLVGFLAEREPVVYRRYMRWWSQIAGEEVRVLPG